MKFPLANIVDSDHEDWFYIQYLKPGPKTGQEFVKACDAVRAGYLSQRLNAVRPHMCRFLAKGRGLQVAQFGWEDIN